MNQPDEPLFLARQSYRRRRLGDAARLLPLLGFVLLCLPVLWANEARTASGLVYLFVLWGLLILAVALISPRLEQSEPDLGETDGAGDAGTGGPAERE